MAPQHYTLNNDKEKEKKREKERLIDFTASGPASTAPEDTVEAKRISMACLVNAAYINELRRHRAEPPAPSQWHTAFDYKLHSVLSSRSDGTIFGAVYVWSHRAALRLRRPRCRPAAVLAFRGTIVSSANVVSDMLDDVKVVFQNMRSASRVTVALDAAREAVRRFGAENVCLAGHSLGAAVALQVGRILAEEGIPLETHLFNPPFFSAVSVRDEKVGALLFRLRSLFADFLHSGEKEPPPAFIVLQKWCPNLYINVHDPVSSGYVHYFAARQKAGAHRSIVSSVLRWAGKNPEPIHLLPTANLFVNTGGSKDFRNAHGLYQWWCESTALRFEHYDLDRCC